MRKSFRKQTGFTLVELLAVIVIMGIIAGIAIPAVLDLMHKQDLKRYQYHETFVKEAATVYTDQYGESFREEQGACPCYKIPYQNLIEEDLLKEEDITCDLNRDNEVNGVILAYPIGDSNRNFRYDYYLTCKDQKSGKIVHQSGNAPSGCCGVNGSFLITNVILKYNDENGAIYPQTENNWTNQNVYQRFEAKNPYMSEIKGYEYSLNGGVNWIFVEGDHFTFTSDMNTGVQVRALDQDGNRSGVYSYSVRIDKTKPTASLGISGTKGQNGWYVSDVNLSIIDQKDTGSGVASASLDRTSITSDTSSTGQPVVITITDVAGNTNTITQFVKVDKTKPSCSSSGGSESWKTSGVTISGTCSDSASGCQGNVSNYLSGNRDGWYSPGTVYDNAGNSFSCPTVHVKIDSSTPSCTTTGGSTAWKSSVTLTGTCSSNGPSACTGNVSKTWNSSTVDGDYSPGSVCNAAGKCVTCPTGRVRVDKTAPATPTVSINCSTGKVTASSSDNSGSYTLTYSVNGSSGSSFNPSCGTTYTASVYATDSSGNRSGTKTASCTTAACCTPIAVGTACSASQLNQSSTCNGVTRWCRLIRINYSYAWSPQGTQYSSNSINLDASHSNAGCPSINGAWPRNRYCQASGDGVTTMWPGFVYNEGGEICPGFSAWGTASGATLTDHLSSYGWLQNHSFVCQATETGRVYQWSAS